MLFLTSSVVGQIKLRNDSFKTCSEMTESTKALSDSKALRTERCEMTLQANHMRLAFLIIILSLGWLAVRLFKPGTSVTESA